MRGEQAAERARSARARADDLSQRLTELREGRPRKPSAPAAEAADLAVRRAATALALSAAAHHQAAALHRRFADLCDEFGQTDRADEQRKLAALDDAAGYTDEGIDSRSG